MHIGLTYDLRDEYLAEGFSEEETAEFDRAETIDAIETALCELGHTVDRIGRARQLVQRLAEGSRWDLVFNICEGLQGIAREAQVPAILEVFGIAFTFADPLAMSLCLHKGMTKLVIERAGLPTPKSQVVRSLADLPPRNLSYPLFAKPIAEGTGKGVTPASCVRQAAELASICQELLHRFQQPVLVEEFLPGREFTVGLLGTGPDARVLGTLEITLLPEAEPSVYSYLNKERCEDWVQYRLVRPDHDPEVRRAEQIALAAWRALECRDAGRIDLRSDARGEPQFLEANPLAGMHPSHSDLPMLATAIGMEYRELIRMIIDSAAQRIVRPTEHASVDSVAVS